RALCLIRRLADGFRHFACLTMTETDAAFLIADDDERSKAEALTALHHFGDAVDVNEAVDELAVFVAVSVSGLTCQGTASFSHQKLRPASRAPSASALTRP